MIFPSQTFLGKSKIKQNYDYSHDFILIPCSSRYFPTTTSFIESAVSSGGLVVVNCVMGWSRSASVVAAYLVMKHKMKATKVRGEIQTLTSIPIYLFLI